MKSYLEVESVLLKAMQWYLQYLPDHAEMYNVLTASKEGMGVGFPFRQVDTFAFDRMLEILHYGVRIYGVTKLFSPEQLKSKAVRIALNMPFYGVLTEMMTEFGVGSHMECRVWPSLGLPNHYTGVNIGTEARWYD
jgi:hypothetical protein